jgi:hypothetical protein
MRNEYEGDGPLPQSCAFPPWTIYVMLFALLTFIVWAFAAEAECRNRVCAHGKPRWVQGECICTEPAL